ncbi:hypothetical protein NDU88_002137 [Pleurodeles waltl]|uniref:Uncharacterized protein n=1 Tax=Pleurodeles waltl TaxID=8319 RepID=A0AAV7NH57_PLEWA|nr:hypothetical protein NDU88_002137 [Pleurodeles waltl]
MVRGAEHPAELKAGSPWLTDRAASEQGAKGTTGPVTGDTWGAAEKDLEHNFRVVFTIATSAPADMGTSLYKGFKWRRSQDGGRDGSVVSKLRPVPRKNILWAPPSGLRAGRDRGGRRLGHPAPPPRGSGTAPSPRRDGVPIWAGTDGWPCGAPGGGLERREAASAGAEGPPSQNIAQCGGTEGVMPPPTRVYRSTRRPSRGPPLPHNRRIGGGEVDARLATWVRWVLRRDG